MPIFRQELEANLKTFQLLPGQAQQVRFYVRSDKADPTMFFLIGFQDPSVQLSLRLPDDSEVRQTSAASKQILWEASPRSEFNFYACPDSDVGHWISITLPNGYLAGEYVVEARLGNAARPSKLCATRWTPLFGQEGVDYEVVGSSVTTGREVYPLGDEVTISVPVRDDAGRPVRNASVEAVVSFQKLQGLWIPQGEAGRFRLTDRKGDGTYSGTFRPGKASGYGVVVTITGRKQREVGHFEVAPLYLKLLSASVVNGAGYAQAVMRFKVLTPGRYRVNPTARDANGKTSWEGLLEDFTAGEHVARWNITRDHAALLELKGPFALTEVHVVRVDPHSESGGELAGWWLNEAGAWRPK